MGITIVHKSDFLKPRPDAPKALILAGGAVSGGSFMAGGVKALGDYLEGFRINDFDIFVGISAGSMIAAALMAGVTPESVVKSLDGTSRHFDPLTARHYYRPNIGEFVARPLRFVMQAALWLPAGLSRLAKRYPEWSEGLLGAIWRFATEPTLVHYEEMMRPILVAVEDMPSLVALLPSGLFDNAPIEQYFRKNIERNDLTNDFREAFAKSGKSLYISAMRLDGAQRVVFGHDEDPGLMISQAIQASTAMPGFYKPARLGGVDYMDGGVQETANIDIAIRKGAKLIVCYNPFRPYEASEFVEGFRRSKEGLGPLASGGLLVVLNQIFRAFFHSRLRVALDHFRTHDKFDGDIILVEPRADDMDFFALNPLSLRNKIKAAALGFESVRNSIDARFDEISKIMAAYGIRMTRRAVEEKYERLSRPEASEEEIQTLLEVRGAALARKRGRRIRKVAAKIARRKAKR